MVVLHAQGVSTKPRLVAAGGTKYDISHATFKSTDVLNETVVSWNELAPGECSNIISSHGKTTTQVPTQKLTSQWRCLSFRRQFRQRRYDGVVRHGGADKLVGRARRLSDNGASPNALPGTYTALLCAGFFQDSIGTL
jgi:hypothetical protein